MSRVRDVLLVTVSVAVLFSLSYWIDARWTPPEEQPRVGQDHAPAAGSQGAAADEGAGGHRNDHGRRSSREARRPADQADLVEGATRDTTRPR
jgi:hypothetical protein